MRSLSLRLASAGLVAAVALLGLAGSASAQTYTWNGTTDNDWNIGANWNPLGPPPGGTNVLFDSSSAANLGTTLGSTSFNIGVVQITSVAGPVSIGGSGTLTLL